MAAQVLYDWFQKPVNATGAPVHVLAENIVALIIRPQLAKEDIDALAKQGLSSELTSDYRYDSTGKQFNRRRSIRKISFRRSSRL